jgi:hypothetical protein
VALRGVVAPGGSLTVDIAVPMRGALATQTLDLRGHLHGFAGDVQVGWSVRAGGVGPATDVQ